MLSFIPLIVAALGGGCPQDTTLFELDSDSGAFEFATDNRESAGVLELDPRCGAEPATDGSESVFAFRARRDGTLVYGSWTGDHDAVVYVMHENEGDGPCISTCGLGSGATFDFYFETEYRVDSEQIYYYIVVDSEVGKLGQGTLRLDVLTGNPVLDASWGAVKRAYARQRVTSAPRAN